MRLYMAASTEYAVNAVENGFVGVARVVYKDEDIDQFKTAFPDPNDRSPEEMQEGESQLSSFESEVVQICEFRDTMPSGFELSRTTEVNVDVPDEDTLSMTVGGGEALADYVGDFILSIEVPVDLARDWEVRDDPPSGWAFRKYWLDPEEANSFRNTLKIFDSGDGEEVRPDLVGK